VIHLNIHSGVELVKLNTQQLNAMPVIDLHVALLSENPENIPEVVKNLSKTKLQALIDVDSWDKDSFNIESFCMWINIALSMENATDSYEVLRKFDKQELCLFIAKILDVDWYDADKIYPSDPFITKDFTFVLFPKDGEEESTTTKQAVALIDLAYLEGMEFGRELCIDVIGMLYSQSEEDAFRLKTSRLADQGLPAYTDALELFYFEDPTKLLKKITKMVGDAKSKKYDQGTSGEYIISGFTVVPKNFLQESLNLDETIIENIKMELSYLLTASIIVNNAADKNAEHIKGVVERSKSYFNLGIELIKESVNKSLSELVTYVPLKIIFRLGFSLLVDLKRNANTLMFAIKEVNQPDFITVDEEEFIKNLQLPIPVLKLNLTDKTKDFNQLADLKLARAKLSEIASRIVKN